MSFFRRTITVRQWFCAGCGESGNVPVIVTDAQAPGYLAEHVTRCMAALNLKWERERLDAVRAELDARIATEETEEIEAPDPVSPALAAMAQQMRAGKLRDCMHCGGYHLRRCPRLRRLVGAVTENELTEVEYWADGAYDQSSITWPEELAAVPEPEPEPEAVA